MSKQLIFLALALAVIVGGVLYLNPRIQTTDPNSILYRNSQYGFTLTLPKTWEGYAVTNAEIEYGWTVTLRHPEWTKEHPRMDIPLLIYPIDQWKKWEATDFEGYHTAAPFGPMERDRNNKYVFATAPRYNYSFAEGFEEVETIIQTLKGFNI